LRGYNKGYSGGYAFGGGARAKLSRIFLAHKISKCAYVVAFTLSGIREFSTKSQVSEDIVLGSTPTTAPKYCSTGHVLT